MRCWVIYKGKRILGSWHTYRHACTRNTHTYVHRNTYKTTPCPPTHKKRPCDTQRHNGHPLAKKKALTGSHLQSHSNPTFPALKRVRHKCYTNCLVWNRTSLLPELSKARCKARRCPDKGHSVFVPAGISSPEVRSLDWHSQAERHEIHREQPRVLLDGRGEPSFVPEDLRRVFLNKWHQTKKHRLQIRNNWGIQRAGIWEQSVYRMICNQAAKS